MNTTETILQSADVELEVINFNIQTIAKVLKKIGATSVEISYDGSGDSGDGVEITVTDISGSRIELDGSEGTVECIEIENNYRHPNRDESPSLSLTTESFDELVEDVLWMAVSRGGHSGWENNDGGGGTMTVHEDGTAELDHFDIITDEDHTMHEFGSTPTVQTSIEP
jgi:hypothetical protein